MDPDAQYRWNNYPPHMMEQGMGNMSSVRMGISGACSVPLQYGFGGFAGTNHHASMVMDSMSQRGGTKSIHKGYCPHDFHRSLPCHQDCSSIPIVAAMRQPSSYTAPRATTKVILCDPNMYCANLVAMIESTRAREVAKIKEEKSERASNDSKSKEGEGGRKGEEREREKEGRKGKERERKKGREMEEEER